MSFSEKYLSTSPGLKFNVATFVLPGVGDFFNDNGNKSPSSISCFIKLLSPEKSPKSATECSSFLPTLNVGFTSPPVAKALNISLPFLVA